MRNYNGYTKGRLKEFRIKLYQEQRHLCGYCFKKTQLRQKLEKDTATIDHKTPVVKGGTHSAENLIMACWACNRKKGDR